MASLNFPSISLLFFFFSLGTRAKTFWGDVTVLKELRNGIDSDSVTPGSCVSSWDFAVDPCDSLSGERFTCGFRCDATVDGFARVTELALDSPGYAGGIADVSWSSASFLQILDLSNNYFSGEIPGSLAGLTRLTRLVLSRNSFSGEISSAIGSVSTLEELYLDNNNLQGSIPASLNGLVNLKRLEIQSNHLSGEFPELGSLTSLYFLDASNNAISGQLPPTLPTSLVQILIRNNTLQSPIPQTITELTYLQVLDLSYNRLTDSVPGFLFTHPSLEQLALASNSFTAVQPPANLVELQSELIAVDLSSNHLGGELPAFMAMMPKLSALSLEKNRLTGMIPTRYAMKVAVPGIGIAQFQRLLLGGNFLFGPIPSPFLGMKPGVANVELGDNCLFRCPLRFFFCQGGDQKSSMECKNLNFPAIP